ncbi:uncharacterized protein BJX67DRAFT_376799 [Aspergillus lucknowensis]|uniref:Uncharacterized protein n=1 Tax=Aspergillus lucknowensis TaxID=176173 RepID=A0ABR4M5U6_9EURO
MILLITFNIGLYVSLCLGYMFTSDNTNAITDTRIPVLFDIYNTQTLPYSETPNANATSDSRQYFLVSGILDSQSISTYGVSILDLSTDERWMYFYPATFTDTHLETFNFSIPGYEISGVSADKTSQMRLYSSREGVEFNITLHATTPAFYYDGTGAYNYVDGIMYNWAFPAMKQRE